eukprot:7905014-Pyramimonas_sp.AAC.1
MSPRRSDHSKHCELRRCRAAFDLETRRLHRWHLNTAMASGDAILSRCTARCFDHDPPAPLPSADLPLLPTRSSE